MKQIIAIIMVVLMLPFVFAELGVEVEGDLGIHDTVVGADDFVRQNGERPLREKRVGEKRDERPERRAEPVMRSGADIKTRAEVEGRSVQEVAREVVEERKEHLVELRERHKELDNFKTERDFKARVLSDEDLKRRQGRAAEAKKRMEERKAAALDHKQKMEEAREAGDDVVLKAEAKSYLGNSADAILAVLSQAKERVSASEHLTEEEVAEHLEKIEAKIVEVTNAKEAIEAAETKDEIRVAAKSITAAWKKAKPQVGEVHEAMNKGRVGSALTQAVQLEEKLRERLVQMEGKGIDTSSAADAVAAFEAEVEIAKDQYALAVDAKTKEEAKPYFDAMKESLKTARDQLRSVLQKVRESNEVEE